MSSARLMLMVTIVGSITLGGLAAADPFKPIKSSEENFHDDLLRVAAEYKKWGRADDEMRWAPTLCRSPEPGKVYVSASKEERTHGQKLYSVFARVRSEYHFLNKEKPVTVGQIIVKQSWLPKEVIDPKEKPGKRSDYTKVIFTPGRPSDPRHGRFEDENDHFYPYVWKGDKVFKATTQADLFIMMKLEPTTPGTDAGWVYGTVTADGKKVTSAGKVASCMKCHQEAKSDRLFGMWK